MRSAKPTTAPRSSAKLPPDTVPPQRVLAEVGPPPLESASPAPSLQSATREMLILECEALRRELAEANVRIAELERLADEDALTPIANRRAFMRELARMIAFAQRYNLPSSVVYFDINGMKQINDVHGHPAGDAALQHCAKLLSDNIRSSDVVGRLGGDEFGVILTQTTEEQANYKAAALAELLRSTPLRWGDLQLPISAAFGVYSFSGGDDAHRAIEAADRAMYQHKRTTRVHR